ncbi:MAG: hypothetical protein QS721_07565 [Candidatus Endonucleobacter sp. (ex Gigantidas childressi)]|nr:hypothetical protein [Candidatus Endonucleobacter sp. (ex Gigantidas childressi)]
MIIIARLTPRAERYVIVFLRILNHEDGYEKKLFKYSFLYFIIIMNTIVALSSQAVYGMQKCNLCGVGEYKKLYDYYNTASKDCMDLDRQPLLSAECTQNFELNGPKASKEKEDFEKSFVKCTHCASLLYINSLSDQLNSLVIGKSSVLWMDVLWRDVLWRDVLWRDVFGNTDSLRDSV